MIFAVCKSWLISIRIFQIFQHVLWTRAIKLKRVSLSVHIPFERSRTSTVLKARKRAMFTIRFLPVPMVILVNLVSLPSCHGLAKKIQWIGRSWTWIHHGTSCSQDNNNQNHDSKISSRRNEGWNAGYISTIANTVGKSPSLVTSMDHCHCPGLLPIWSLPFVSCSRESSSGRNCTVQGKGAGDWKEMVCILECHDMRIDVGSKELTITFLYKLIT